MSLESMRIVTGCKTAEQFVSLFHRFCDAKTCFIPTADTRPVGSSLAFSLRLADGTSMLRGTCVVTAAWKDKHNEYKRPGVQLEIQKLAPDSVALFEQLLSQRTEVVDIPPEVKNAPSDGIVETVTTVTTNQHVPRDKAIDLILRSGNAPMIRIPSKPTPSPDVASGSAPISSEPPIEVKPPEPPPAAEPEATATVEMPPLQYKIESRVPGSAIVLPANPLTDVDEKSIDALLSCSMGAEQADAPPLDESQSISVDEMPAVKAREEMKTLLGIAPLTVPRRDTQRTPPIIVDEPTAPMPSLFAEKVVPERVVHRTRPLALQSRPPAALRAFALHAMSANERFWYLCALGAVLLLGVLVVVSAFASAS